MWQDEDGDLCVERGGPAVGQGQVPLRVWHSAATPLCGVGTQLWRGALLVGEAVGTGVAGAGGGGVACELGAGVGLVGMLWAHTHPAGTVYVTGEWGAAALMMVVVVVVGVTR